mgnify:CR=1 FL=1
MMRRWLPSPPLSLALFVVWLLLNQALDAATLLMAMFLAVVVPLLTRVFGYFPGKRLGWLEDTPSGVVHDWTTRTPRYEHRPSGRALAALPFAQVRAKTLAISLTDDPFGTVAATERLLGYLQSAERQHLRIAPVDISVEEIGHFAFFHDRFTG